MFKKILPGAMIVFTISLLLTGMMFRNVLVSNLSKKIAPITNLKTGSLEAAYIDSSFNYLKNKQEFQLTFIEFGSTYCGECKKMEEVMQLVRVQFSEKVKVVFINVSLKENSAMTKYFGIVMIPVQVLLDKNGIEVYRHVGYLSFNELSNEINKRF